MIPTHRSEIRWCDFGTALRQMADPTSQERLRQALQAYFQVNGVLLVPSGRAGLYYVLRALPERKIFMPAYTCSVVREAAERAGKEVRFLDINLDTYNVPYTEVLRALEPHSILLATHQYGIPCEIERFVQLATARRCVVIEDSAAAFGSAWDGRKTGTFGAASILSFGLSKPMCCGTGGAILFTETQLMRSVQQLIEEASPHRRMTYESLLFAGNVGVNILGTYAVVYGLLFRLLATHSGKAEQAVGYLPPRSPKRLYEREFGALEAALGLHWLQRCDSIIARRKQIATVYWEYLQALDDIALPVMPDGAQAVLMRMPLRLLRGARDEFRHRCARLGVNLGTVFSQVCVDEAFQSEFPNSYRAAQQMLNLPISALLSDRDVMRVVSIVRQALRDTGSTYTRKQFLRECNPTVN
jgi:dTDP-4-amino-4,6-dideoxygalactose transaminase